MRSTPTLVTRTMTGTQCPLRSLCSWKLRGELRHGSRILTANRHRGTLHA